MSGEPDRRVLRATFEEVAELYDRARPAYPDAVLDDVVALSRLPEGGRIAEIGCGAGVATLPLAERGLAIVGIELGAQLAAIARRKLAGFPKVEVVNAPFETWEPEGEFDAVCAFTAFHWIEPDVRYSKSARILRPGGALAVVQTKHVAPEGSEPFWVEVQEDYDAVAPSEDNRPPPRSNEVGDLAAEVAASGLFGEVVVRRHLWDVRYTAESYLAVLDTYSGHRAMAPAARRELFDRIAARIEQHGGSVTKTYLATVNVARRR